MKRNLEVKVFGDNAAFWLKADDGRAPWISVEAGDRAQVALAEAVLFTAAPVLLSACELALELLADIRWEPGPEAYNRMRKVLQAAIEDAHDTPVREAQ